MRWSKKGALSLAKAGQKIVSNEWDSWWPKEIAQREPDRLRLEKSLQVLDTNYYGI